MQNLTCLTVSERMINAIDPPDHLSKKKKKQYMKYVTKPKMDYDMTILVAFLRL